MKKTYKIAFMTLAVATTLTGCGNADAPDQSPAENPEITVSLKGVKPSTRAIIEGETLPDGSMFSLFLMPENTDSFIEGGENIAVTYKNGACSMNSVAFPTGVERVSAYAFYPFNEMLNVFSTSVSAGDNTDYLWGYSVDLNNMPSYATTNNPKVEILFEHIMARITLHFTKEDSDTDTYYFPGAYIEGYGDGHYKSAEVSIWRREIYPNKPNGYTDIYAELSGDQLDDDKKTVTADYLIIPSDKAEWTVRTDNNLPEFTLPARAYESGYQYSYNVKIVKNAAEPEAIQLVVSDCEIKPWQDYPLGPTDVEAEPAE